jgi:hypothetical protein
MDMRYPNQAHTTAASWVTTNPTLLPLHIQPASPGYELLTVLRLCLEELRNIRQLLARLVEAVQPLFQLLHRDAWYMFAYFVADWVVGLIASVAGVIQAKK